MEKLGKSYHSAVAENKLTFIKKSAEVREESVQPNGDDVRIEL